MAKQFKKPDLKAPRYRIDRMLLLNKKLYLRFIEKFPEHSHISIEEFKKIIKTFNTNIWENVIEGRDGVELPEGLGFLFVGTCAPPKKNNLDPIASINYGQQIKHRNFESDNYLAKIFYTNFASKYKFKDREVWKFIAFRDFKRKVAKTYPEKWKQYVVVDNYQRISKLFMKQITKNIAKIINKKVSSDYNEFAMD